MTTEITALSEQEILALAISLEEEDARIYRDLAEKVRVRFPGTASILDSMREEETSHRARLHEFYLGRFGDHVLYVRRQDVKGFLKRRPLWLHPAPNPRQILRLVSAMEDETRRFYQDAANHAPSEEVRALLTDLAEAEEDRQDLLVAETRAQKRPE
jgi:rubrerythrin